MGTNVAMQGKVKWFSVEKGYGYIAGNGIPDHYFNIRDVHGAELPGNGDVVTFESSPGKKGPRAKSVVISAKATATERAARSGDDRDTCAHCGKKMVPRLVTYQGTPQKSLCPYCGEIHKDFRSSWCYIATAVYGDYYAPEVIALRRFRDETLSRSIAGRLFIAAYYRFSPPLAAYFSRRRRLAAVVRPLLTTVACRYE